MRGRHEVHLTLNGALLGNELTDNAYENSGYRYHDVFHLAYAAVLGWSPVRRQLMKQKRKTCLMAENELIENTLSLFQGRCGHQWVGATGGSFACPLCGDHDGDHHLLRGEPIAVQPEDWGAAWDCLKRSAVNETRW